MPRQDDPALIGEFVVYRRIPPYPDHVLWSEDGLPEPVSQNFKDRRNELSVHLAQETTPETTLAGHPDFGLVELTLQVFRDTFQSAGRPVIICRDDQDPANGHILICGEMTKKMAKQISKAARWVEGYWPARMVE